MDAVVNVAIPIVAILFGLPAVGAAIVSVIMVKSGSSVGLRQ